MTLNATDIHKKTLTKTITKQGRFPLESKKEIPENYHKFLIFEKDSFQINPEVTKKIIFSHTDIFNAPSLFGMDIVISQNIFFFLKKVFKNLF